jgi:hypothetical protein
MTSAALIRLSAEAVRSKTKLADLTHTPAPVSRAPIKHESRHAYRVTLCGLNQTCFSRTSRDGVVVSRPD